MTIYKYNELISGLRINQYQFGLTDNLSQTQSLNGSIWTASQGPRLWHGSISLRANTHDGQRRMDGMIDSIINGNTFFEYSPNKARFPIADPDGSKIGARNVTIASPKAGFSVTLSGLPRGYELTIGDLFSYRIGNLSIMHKIASGGSADSNGMVTVGLVNPILGNAIPVNNVSVTLINPVVTCQYVPQSISWGSVQIGSSSGASFNFIQTVKQI